MVQIALRLNEVRVFVQNEAADAWSAEELAQLKINYEEYKAAKEAGTQWSNSACAADGQALGRSFLRSYPSREADQRSMSSAEVTDGLCESNARSKRGLFDERKSNSKDVRDGNRQRLNEPEITEGAWSSIPSSARWGSVVRLTASDGRSGRIRMQRESRASTGLPRRTAASCPIVQSCPGARYWGTRVVILVNSAMSSHQNEYHKVGETPWRERRNSRLVNGAKICGGPPNGRMAEWYYYALTLFKVEARESEVSGTKKENNKGRFSQPPSCDGSGFGVDE
ncbi:hypothetical protein B0H13DRAFT_1914076 [Mycena leptocephala]|nr:hypothetical protein B0H13DRAFT_1914076 [Mycena leptocephala]